MCGIVGAIGNKIDGSFLENLFIATEPRGTEATGFWFPSTGIVKDALKVSEFLPLYEDEFKEGIEKDNVFMGHCRLATHGEPAYNDNNHPHESENYIMVHNGVVSMKDIEDYPYKSDTDTENILAYIEHYGITEGLQYCTSGASIIFTPKGVENTLYLWKTTTSDMLIAYDMDNETIYVCSGDKYMKEALDPLSEKPERLGGLFSIADRRIKVTEPKARELWKVTLVNGEIHSTMIKTISAVYGKQNGYGGNNRQHACGYRSGYQYNWQRDGDLVSENGISFCPLGTGNNRPSVLDGTVKGAKILRQEAEEWEKERTARFAANRQKTTSAASGTGNTHANGDNGTTIHKVTKPACMMNMGGLLVGDFVQLSRNLVGSDPVYASNGGAISDLEKGDILVVKKQLQNARYAIEDAVGNLFTVPRSVIELAENPNCFAIGYMALSERCLNQCWWRHECKAAVEQYKDEELPECAGTFETGDEDCTNCWYLAPCLKLVQTLREERLAHLHETGAGEVIDVDAVEVHGGEEDYDS